MTIECLLKIDPRKISDTETWSMDREVLHFRSVGRDVACSQQRRQAVEPLAFVDVFAAWSTRLPHRGPLEISDTSDDRCCLEGDFMAME